MAGVIYDVLQTSFLKFTGQRDVTLMAAERLALNFLDDAWKELKKHEVQEDEKSTGRRQVGL